MRISFLILSFFMLHVNAEVSKKVSINKVVLCGENVQSRQLAQLIINSKIQQRKELICNEKLAKIAYLKAKELAREDKIQHSINNTSPNEFLTQNGIKLPAFYPVIGNQVEAIQGGLDSAQEAFDYFLSSHDHKEHLLGENDFYKQQKHIGIGYYSDDEGLYEKYWVVYITALRADGLDIQESNRYKFKIIIDKPPRERFKRGDTVKLLKNTKD